MSMLFARRSGICVYEHVNYQAMGLPLNLAQYLHLNGRMEVNIRSGYWIFGMGYLRGFGWRTLVEECELDIVFKIFFFINLAEEFEMIVVGYDNHESVYEWSRSYYKVL